VLLLSTTGRTSGKRRTTPLIYQRHGTTACWWANCGEVGAVGEVLARRPHLFSWLPHPPGGVRVAQEDVDACSRSLEVG
jgi:hypothetical protein